MSYLVIRIPRRPKRAIEGLIASEAHVIDRGRVIWSWYTCARCGRVHQTKEGAGACCSTIRGVTRK